MFAQKLDMNAKVVAVEIKKVEKDATVRGYQAPEMHAVGKAIDLVQGGGGGNYSDANRSRYY